MSNLRRSFTAFAGRSWGSKYRITCPDVTGNPLNSTEVDLRVELDPRRVRLKLADAGEGLNGGEKAPVAAFLYLDQLWQERRRHSMLGTALILSRMEHLVELQEHPQRDDLLG